METFSHKNSIFLFVFDAQEVGFPASDIFLGAWILVFVKLGEVAAGYECGIGLKKCLDIQVGDILEAYIMEEVER